MSNFLFNSIRVPKLRRNKFNLSHDVKLSMRMGELIPIFCQDVVPGDTFKLNTELLIRFAPLIAPVMHRINVYTHYFFVPKRLIWDNWEQFITGGESGEDSPAYPRYRMNDTMIRDCFCEGSLADYLGFPVRDRMASPDSGGDGRFMGEIVPTFEIDALPFRAYQLIWNEYYRDQNLQDEFNFGKDSDGVINPCTPMKTCMTLRSRAWTKDYFTSALPFTQRGGEVTLPLYGNPTVTGTGHAYTFPEQQTVAYEVGSTGGADFSKPFSGQMTFDGGSATNQNKKIASSGGSININDVALGLDVDLSNVSAATINELRRAIKAQEFLEATARSGSRYTEFIRGIFGVKSSDARLQRPEYLGGGKQPVVVSDVMQTSQSTQESALGTPGGAAASLGKTHSFKKYFEEYGYVIGIMSVLPVPAYQQGMPRQFLKFDKYDHYIPQFAHLGEQEITSQELYFDPTTSGNDALFGYAPRYAEYKFINSSVHGDFRTSLKYWHMGRIFNARPELNGSFVTSNPTDRIFAVEDSDVDKLWVNIHHNCTALRPMPKYGTPLL